MGKIKIGIVSDVHLDMAHDGEKRIDAFLNAAREENVDMIMHLGDFAYPNDTSKTKCPFDKMPPNIKNAYEQPSKVDKEAILKKYRAFEKPAYHTLGNHDFDFLEPEDTFRMYGIENGYYSFHSNGWHFIVLDGNYLRDENGSYVHYDCGNYFYRDLPYLGTEQLKWLRKELKASDEPALLFSHQALFDCPGHIKDLPEFEKIINEAKARGKEIRMCFSGHLHIDRLDLVDSTYYLNVTSLFGYYVRDDYDVKHYCDKTEAEFPNLRLNVIFSKPLFTIITLDDEGFSIKGIKGSYVKPGLKDCDSGVRKKISASVKARSHKWVK